jgi:hypothetical protein
MVDPASLGRDGRMVRCAKCEHSWMQRPPIDMPKSIDLAPEPEPELEEIVRPIPQGSNPPATPRKPPPKPNKPRPKPTKLIVAFSAVSLLAGLVFARQQIVDIWPPAALLFETVGLPVDTLGAGLQLQDVKSEKRIEDGAMVLVIEGRIANISDRERPVPPLHAKSLGPDKTAVADWTFRASHETLLPGEIATFQSTIREPSGVISEISITFQAGQGG